MAALTANRSVTFFTDVDQSTRNYPVVAADHIYLGGYIGKDPAGNVKPFEPGDLFLGVAYEEKDNSSGAAAALNCRVIVSGDFLGTITSVTKANVGQAVYATTDGDLALTGHPDAFVGRVISYETTNTAVIRMREFGQRPGANEGSVELVITGHENFAATGATAGTTSVGGFDLKSILGTGWVCNDAENGGIKGDFDATAEIALCSARTRNDCLPIDKGITMDVDLVVADIGDAAAIDVDWGLGTALTTNSEASIDHADMVQLACFHLDGAADDVLAQSDDNTTDVAAVDTTVDNDSTTDVSKHYKIIVRPTGTVEFWIANARVLSTTTFAMLSTALAGAFINMEKTSDDTTASIIFRNLRVAGGSA